MSRHNSMNFHIHQQHTRISSCLKHGHYMHNRVVPQILEFPLLSTSWLQKARTRSACTGRHSMITRHESPSLHHSRTSQSDSCVWIIAEHMSVRFHDSCHRHQPPCQSMNQMKKWMRGQSNIFLEFPSALHIWIFAESAGMCKISSFFSQTWIPSEFGAKARKCDKSKRIGWSCRQDRRSRGVKANSI